VVGVLGGGQLGRMMAEAGHRLGIQLAILDPGGPQSPAGQVAKLAVEGSFRDEEKIKQLAQISDVLTVEIEHVNCDILEAIEESGKPVHPSPKSIRIIQDKYQQKVHLQALPNNAVPLPEFLDCPTLDAALDAGEKFGYPLMLKAKKMAYDGKGNAVADSRDKVSACFDQLSGASAGGGVYAEKWCPFVKELAVMVARSSTGEVRSYPVVETVQENNICHSTLVPIQGVSSLALERAAKIASAAIASLFGAGIFGVELFLLADDTVLLNEIAPRPHNSGHYTIEACETDQFEQHLRCILGLPLGGCDLRVGAALMVNILGQDTAGKSKGGADAAQRMRATQRRLARALDVPGGAVHWYGKGDAKKGRKMAHLTLTASSLPLLADRARALGNDMLVPGLIPEPGTCPLVGIIMGSDSDLPHMKAAAEVLEKFAVPFELTVVSAHRTPHRMYEYAQQARRRGIKVIIAGAGGAAHLPGMTAALTGLPVIGVPVKTSTLSGVDSLHSIVQMPRGVPVATVAIGNSTNAGLLAARIIGVQDPSLMDKMEEFLKEQDNEVMGKVEKIRELGYQKYLSDVMGK